MPILNPTKANYDNNGIKRSLLDRIFNKLECPKFKEGIIYGTLIQEGKIFVITREHEPIEVKDKDYNSLFKSIN
ncbi:MAG: hypothetical protein HOP11_14365 [Saprospiraceae bacterium]|nr:hypothetical protein [Saprospiraceae bacterium]